MSGILLALGAHFANGLVFVVDKSLLSSGGGISNPVKYAFFSSILAAIGIIALPFDFAPLTVFVAKWSVLAGIARIIALLLFFTALQRGESSRVVPIAGSSNPVFTVIIATFFLGELFTGTQFFAMILLIVGGALLSIRFKKTKGLTLRVALYAVAAGLFFALYFVLVKHLHDNAGPFLAVFGYSRFLEGVAALVLLGPIVWIIQRRSASRGSRAASAVPSQRRGFLIPAVFVGNKGLAAGAFALQTYAIKEGSVSIVNALQGAQYLFVLLLAAAVSVWFPSLFREELHRVALSQKLAGILFVSVGLAMLLWQL